VLASGFTDEIESLTMLMHPELRASLRRREDARTWSPRRRGARVLRR